MRKDGIRNGIKWVTDDAKPSHQWHPDLNLGLSVSTTIAPLSTYQAPDLPRDFPLPRFHKSSLPERRLLAISVAKDNDRISIRCCSWKCRRFKGRQFWQPPLSKYGSSLQLSSTPLPPHRWLILTDWSALWIATQHCKTHMIIRFWCWILYRHHKAFDGPNC